MIKRHQLTLTLRARFAGDDLIPGTLFASPKGRVANRILEATPVLRAGEQGYRVRIVCARVSPAEVLEGAKLLPWPSDRRAPRGSRSAAGPQRPSTDPRPPVPPAARIARIRAKAPLLRELATAPIRQAKAAVETAQLARPRHVGRDLGMVNAATTAPAFGWRRSVRTTQNGCGPVPAAPSCARLT